MQYRAYQFVAELSAVTIRMSPDDSRTDDNPYMQHDNIPNTLPHIALMQITYKDVYTNVHKRMFDLQVSINVTTRS